ncbi:MAG TPA: phosphodiester glycosidase family protein [Hyalangium sp.]|jgi:hypothetical protein|nr:phosphodiester glycosidase family protein [Hyalangium sp.]
MSRLVCIGSVVLQCVIMATAFFGDVAKAAAPTVNSITYTSNGDTTRYYYLTIDLRDVYLGLTAATANNRNPVNDSWWEPRWVGDGDHRQYALDMYNGISASNKWALINTDYFCRGGCAGSFDVPPGSGQSPAGNPGSPQGLFIRRGTLYHRAPSSTSGPRNRAALTFASDKKASIRSFNWSSSTTGITTGVGGGPIILQNGAITCNPEGSDLGYRCGTELQKRSGACIDSTGYKLYLIVNFNGYTTNWGNLANFMKFHLGCYNGMQFDGGGSPALVVSGQALVSGDKIGSGLFLQYGYWSAAPTQVQQQPDATSPVE